MDQPKLRSDAQAAGDLDRALGNAIRTRRRALNLSQDQLARACGVSAQQVQMFELGARRVSFARLGKIAQALDCRVTDLTGDLDLPPTTPTDSEIPKLLTLHGMVDLPAQTVAERKHLRAKLHRLHIEFLLAVVSGTLFFLTIARPEWLELMTPFDPDRGSTSAEWAITAVLCAVALAASLSARAHYRELLAKSDKKDR
jgi:transcriptional regulator with XRE-family HTH domain